jgi:two-component system, cell cycle sensor histidine kinase and response regulator CckA
MSAREASIHPPMTPGDYVLMSLSDTGQGMDDETKAHIFEPFFTTKETGKGTGLGLATVYGIIKQSGGFVWVESSPGHGARFDIYLPSTTKPVTATDLVVKTAVLPRGTETILVVEDEADVRDLACQFLKASGYSVLEAKDGVEALETIARQNEPIHLILSDILMPRMGGHEMAFHLKLCCPEMRILFMTGYSEYSDNEEKAEPRHDSLPIVQKPFSRRTLLEKIGEALAMGPRKTVNEQQEQHVQQLASESQITRSPAAG